MKFLTYKEFKKGRILSSRIDLNGYEAVALKNKTRKVHRLMAAAFLGLDADDLSQQVNHLNGIKSDNSLSNLEVCTQSENMKHAYRVLGVKPTAFWLGKKGKNNPCSKRVEKIDSEGNVIATYDALTDAEIDGYDHANISAVCLGKRKHHGGFKWRYVDG